MAKEKFWELNFLFDGQVKCDAIDRRNSLSQLNCVHLILFVQYLRLVPYD